MVRLIYFFIVLSLAITGCATGNAPKILAQSEDNKKVVIVNAIDEQFNVQQVGVSVWANDFQAITPTWSVNDILTQSINKLNKYSRFNIIASDSGTIGQLTFQNLSGLSGAYDLMEHEGQLRPIIEKEKPDYLLVITGTEQALLTTNQFYHGIGYLRWDNPGKSNDVSINHVVITGILVDPISLQKYGRAKGVETAIANFKQFPEKENVVDESKNKIKASSVEKVMNNGPSQYQVPVKLAHIEPKDIDINKKDIEELMLKALMKIGKQIKLIPDE